MRTPAGITATPAEGTVVDGARRITLAFSASPAQGFYDVHITVTSGDTAGEQPVALTVAAPGTLPAARDNTGVSDDEGDHDEADHGARTGTWPGRTRTRWRPMCSPPGRSRRRTEKVITRVTLPGDPDLPMFTLATR